MAHKDTILDFLRQHKGFYCEDCLSENCNIKPRQTIFQVCTKLHKNNLIYRDISKCDYCGAYKKVSSLKRVPVGIENKNMPQKNIDTAAKQIHKKVSDVITSSDTFVEVALDFEVFDIMDTFANFKAHTLQEMINKDKYSKLSDMCHRDYGACMDMKLGPLLKILKEKGSDFY